MIATDCVTAYAFNLSALAGASNMHAMPCYSQIGEKILFSIFLEKIFFCKTDFESETKKTIVSALEKS